MRYLKYFENEFYTTDNIDKKLYEPIDISEHNRLRGQNRYEKFTQTEIDSLKKIQFEKTTKPLSIKYNGECVHLYPQENKYNGGCTIVIDKLSDDWFLIKDFRCPAGSLIKHFKCDTLKGVLQYLDDYRFS